MPRKSNIGAQFSARRIDMLESPAYRTLSLSAHRVIDRIAIEHMHHGAAENGRLPVTYDDFEKYGIHRHAIAPAIREAAALGFIEVTRPGRAGNAAWRQPAHYRITFHRMGNEPNDGTHEWMSITEEEAPLIAEAARRATTKKTKVQWRKTPNIGGGIRTTKRPSHSAESTTTGVSAESTTTFYILGRDRDVA